MIWLSTIGDVLGSPVWTVLATILTAATIAVSIILYRRQRPRKCLGYSLQASPVVRAHSALTDQVKITYEDKDIKQADLVILELRNTGNVPVVPEDFKQPISVTFPDGASPLGLPSWKSRPAGLEPDAFLDGGDLVVAPLLLNPGDRVSIAALVRDYGGHPKLTYRIVGISKLDDFQDQKPRPFRLQALELAATSSVIAALLIAAAGSLISTVFGGGSSKTHAEVRLSEHRTLCADVLQTGESQSVLKLPNSRVVTVATEDVESIKEDAC